LRYGWYHLDWICEGGQVNEPYPIREIIQQLCGHLDRQAGLAYSRRACESHKPNPEARQTVSEHGELPRPPDKGRGRDRQARGTQRIGGKRRGIGGQQPIDTELTAGGFDKRRTFLGHCGQVLGQAFSDLA
jgi:hypothetical protein